ncbi:MAG: transposase [Opitutaceae bacterium]|nr:transposase [Opitutaceae bacterium]
MNLAKELNNLKAKAAALEAKIAREKRKKLLRLPKLAGLSSVAELIAALQDVSGKGRGQRRSGKRIRLDPQVKAKLIAEAIKPGADRRALAKKYGANLNSLRVWAAQAKHQK